ncbi:MAG: hypothetical protein JWP92_1092 [Caulobacter sp.]|nr:hypothetical protein [Caulobacter sp.]
MKLRVRRQMTTAALGVAIAGFAALLAWVVWHGQGPASTSLHGFGVLMLMALVVAPLVGEAKRLAALEQDLGPEAETPAGPQLTNGHIAVLIFVAGAAAMIIVPRLLAHR